MIIVGYLSAILVGIILGLLGAGGSILMVPILAYLFHVPAVQATAYSLFVVGLVALLGAVSNIRQGFVDFRVGLIFATPALTTVFLTRKYVVPALPEIIYSGAAFTLTKDMLILMVFAIVMIWAAFSMLRPKKIVTTEQKSIKDLNFFGIALEGLVVGFITGFVGAGGGFLIIPALVLLVGLPMKRAVGTSLLIVAIKSLFGFLGDLGETQMDWGFLTLFTSLAMLGMYASSYLSQRIPGERLKPVFGWFVLIMGIFILLKETLF